MSETTLAEALRQRAAIQREVVDVDEPVVKLVIFALGDAWFAFRGEHIREIIGEAPVFFVPGCPESLEGVINVRGDIASVIGLAALLGRGGSGSAGKTILLGEAAGIFSGLRVDRVIEVVDLPQSVLQAPPANLGEPLARLVTAVLQFDGRPVSLLGLDVLLSEYVRGL